MVIVPLALGPSFLTDMGCSKKVSFGIFSIIKTTKNRNIATVKFIDKVPSLSKFSRYLVKVKIVKIRHLIGLISYMNKIGKN